MYVHINCESSSSHKHSLSTELLRAKSSRRQYTTQDTLHASSQLDSLPQGQDVQSGNWSCSPKCDTLHNFHNLIATLLYAPLCYTGHALCKSSSKHWQFETELLTKHVTNIRNQQSNDATSSLEMMSPQRPTQHRLPPHTLCRIQCLLRLTQLHVSQRRTYTIQRTDTPCINHQLSSHSQIMTHSSAFVPRHSQEAFGIGWYERGSSKPRIIGGDTCKLSEAQRCKSHEVQQSQSPKISRRVCDKMLTRSLQKIMSN